MRIEKGRRGLGFFGFWVFCLFVCLIEKTGVDELALPPND